MTAKGSSSALPPVARDIRVLRAMLGLSREEFATLFQQSPSTVIAWELGHRVPSGTTEATMASLKRKLEELGSVGQENVRTGIRSELNKSKLGKVVQTGLVVGALYLLFDLVFGGSGGET